MYDDQNTRLMSFSNLNFVAEKEEEEEYQLTCSKQIVNFNTFPNCKPPLLTYLTLRKLHPSWRAPTLRVPLIFHSLLRVHTIARALRKQGRVCTDDELKHFILRVFAVHEP
ncbi:hypothetical protein SK128_027069 [Halocaridina rubra]|uniref:Uncharacterized protein n=1 Tax=Halocaridina rubra TaxID=373956 RepID=A0AAN8WVZ4_HALRR